MTRNLLRVVRRIGAYMTGGQEHRHERFTHSCSVGCRAGGRGRGESPCSECPGPGPRVLHRLNMHAANPDCVRGRGRRLARHDIKLLAQPVRLPAGHLLQRNDVHTQDGCSMCERGRIVPRWLDLLAQPVQWIVLQQRNLLDHFVGELFGLGWGVAAVRLMLAQYLPRSVLHERHMHRDRAVAGLPFFHDGFRLSFGVRCRGRSSSR